MTSARRLDPNRETIPLGVVRRLVAGLLRMLFRLRVVGAENLPTSGPVLLAGNHTGFLDGPIVFMVLPRPSFFLVKSELYSGPWAKVLEFARQIPIRRGTPDRTALRQALDVLASGGVLGVFPEGTRGEGRLESVQHGIGYLALRAGCPVVPVVCTGTADALPKGKLLPRFRVPVDVVFGPAFEVRVDGDPRARSSVADAAEQVRVHLLAHLEAVTADAA
ncbi:MAG TPA: lysophospholipid acyltransferase family protein [Mycobacteriales bacterium]|nr:lysophospholipid acyltransferase family protein [Mycobacteriales bacterium]